MTRHSPRRSNRHEVSPITVLENRWGSDSAYVIGVAFAIEPSEGFGHGGALGQNGQRA